MPKTLMLCHVVLLFCLSLLVFTNKIGTPSWLGFVAVGLAVLLFFTEMFSGLWWPVGAAVLAGVVALIADWGRTAESPVSAWAWGVAWLAVVIWFALLAFTARENR